MLEPHKSHYAMHEPHKFSLKVLVTKGIIKLTRSMHHVRYENRKRGVPNIVILSQFAN